MAAILFFRKNLKLFPDIYLSNELHILENLQLDTSLIDFVSLSWTLWPTVVLAWKFPPFWIYANLGYLFLG